MRREISLIKSLTKQSGLKRVEEKLSNRESGKKLKKKPERFKGKKYDKVLDTAQVRMLQVVSLLV